MSEIPTKAVPIDSLTPHPENYNLHPESQIAELAESDQSFGQYRNVVVWSPDSEIDLGNGQKLYPDISYILAGNGYWLGRRRAGRDTIEVKDYTGIPYEDALMLMQIDNAAPLGAQPDADRLKVLLEKTRERAVDAPRLGAMLARLRESVGVNGNGAEPAPGPQVDKAAQLAEKWGTRTGQVWQLGVHRLAVGDCTDKAVVEAVMRGERADCMTADPPYGMNLYTNHTKTRDNSKSTIGGRTIKNYAPVRGDDKPFDRVIVQITANEEFWFGADYYVDTLPNFGKDGAWFVWDKRQEGAVDEQRGNNFELIWSSNRHKRWIFRIVWSGVLGHNKQLDGDQKCHPTQKPVKLLCEIISKYTNQNDLIIDPFLGSGTTLIACEQLKRKCRAIEIDPGYCGVAIQRWADLTHQDPILLSE